MDSGLYYGLDHEPDFGLLNSVLEPLEALNAGLP